MLICGGGSEMVTPVIVIDDIIDSESAENGCAAKSANGGSNGFPPAVQRILRAQPLSPLSRSTLTIPVSFFDVIDGDIHIVQVDPPPQGADAYEIPEPKILDLDPVI